MKKSLLMKSILLLFALIIGSTHAWADTYNSGTIGTLSSGDNTINNVKWNVNMAGSTYFSSETQSSERGSQFGSKNNPATSVTLTTSAISGTISNITVNASAYSSSATIAVSVGGNAYGNTRNLTSSNAAYSFDGTSSGEISIVLTNASTGGRAMYIKSISVTYTASSSNPSITLSSNSVNASAEDTDGTINVTYNNISSVDSEVKFYESDGTTAATYDWVDAEIDNSNNLYYVIGANTGAVRTAYMKVHQKNTEVYSELITITQEEHVAAPVVTLDFSTNSWGISSNPTKTVAETEFTSGGYTITLKGSSGNGYYFDTNNIMLGKLGATLTLPAFGFNVSKIKVYGTSNASASVTFNVYVSDDAVSTAATGSTTDHEFAIAAEKQAVGTIYTIKVTNAANMRISKIEVFGNGCEAGIVTDAGWATYVTDCDMEFVEGDAYVVSAATASTATLVPVTKIRANQPVVLKGEGAKTALVLDETPAAVANELRVSTGGSVDGFVLAKNGTKVGFYKWNGGLLTSGKVYLPTPAGARDYLAFSFEDGETTALTLVNSEKRIVNSEVYDLQGRKVAQPTKGLYIVNGKKVLRP